MAIPKIIHYAWFSDQPMDDIYQKCFKSWSIKLPDYKLQLWDKSININSRFFNKMLDKQKWAFASDYIRLCALYNYGGIWLDLDVRVVKNFTPLLEKECIIGREDENSLACHMIAAHPGHPFIKECLDYYDNSFRLKISAPPTMPRIINKLASKYGLQKTNTKQTLTNDITVYPSAFFSPLHYKERLNKNPQHFIRAESYCIHYWQHSWSWLDSKSLKVHLGNQPWLFMNFDDWKRFLIQQLGRVKSYMIRIKKNI